MNSEKSNCACRGGFFTLALCIIIPLAVGWLASFLTKNAQIAFVRMAKPPLAPPAWLFPIVWTLMYVLMGIAFYFIYTSESEIRSGAITLYIIQLIFNFAWCIIFFRNGTYWFAAAWLFVLWLMLVCLILLCTAISKAATWLLVPYLLWCTYAFYLNIGIAILNK